MSEISVIWQAYDSRLLIACLAALIAIVLLIAVIRLPPFLAIMAGCVVAGTGTGLPALQVQQAFIKGAGEMLGGTGTLIALGAMLGALMTASGAADRLATTLTGFARGRSLPWMVALVAMMLGLPLFFEVGLVVMVPLIHTFARQSRLPLLSIAIPALAGMTTLHALLPPHPGPLIALSALHADAGLTFLFGLLIALPAVILAGPLYGSWLSARLQPLPSAGPGVLTASPDTDGADAAGVSTASGNPLRPAVVARAARQPGFIVSLLIALLPASLMLCRTLARLMPDQHAAPARIMRFAGDPLPAMALTVLAAAILLGWGRGMSRERLGSTLTLSLAPIAGLLLTLGAGGGLKETLLQAHISQTVSKVALLAHLPWLPLAWLIAVVLRQATGSATVATATAAGIMAPLVAGLPAAQCALLALAIGAGSVFFCHVNDAGFWMVREYFGLQLSETLWVWSLLQTLVSLVGLAGTMLLWWYW